MNLGTLVKSPQDHLDYDILFYRWLGVGDKIRLAETAIRGSASISRTETSDDTIKIWVKGGQSGELLEISVLAKTMQGRTINVCFHLHIRGNCS